MKSKDQLREQVKGYTMTRQEHLLVLLMEACAEVSHRCSKALRFGLKETQKGCELDNAERIDRELQDLCELDNAERIDRELQDLLCVVQAVKEECIVGRYPSTSLKVTGAFYGPRSRRG